MSPSSIRVRVKEGAPQGGKGRVCGDNRSGRKKTRQEEAAAEGGSPRRRDATRRLRPGAGARPQVAALLHCADLHSPVMEPELDMQLADLISQEFEMQAALELELGMQPTVMNTSTLLAKASMEARSSALNPALNPAQMSP